MCIIRIVLLLILCAVFSAQVKAQTEQFASLNVEYGDLSELAGKNRVFVHTENLESRGKILKELAKSRFPRFEVVGKITEADFLLVYGSNLVRNSASSLDGFTAAGDTTIVYGDMIALKLIKDPNVEGLPVGNHTRILWYTRRRQMFIRTDQFLRPFQSKLNGSKSSWIALLISTVISSHPKLSWLPLSRNPEAGAIRDFLKALKKADESIKLNTTTLPLLDKPVLVRRPRQLNP